MTQHIWKCIFIFFTFYIVFAEGKCDQGKITLTESIPTDLSLRHFEEDTYDSWKRIISSARETIEIACYYMSLTDGMDFHPGQGGWKGQSIFDSLKVAKNQHGVKIRIAQNLPTPNMPDKDTSNLSRLGVAEVRSLDFPKLLKGSGILHTKFIIVDGKHAYVGSANMDWRSISQVKETGLIVESCEEFAGDLRKVFEMYWDAAIMTSVPNPWPSKYDTIFNSQNQISVSGSNLFISSSPHGFASKNRENEIDTIKGVIKNATTEINFSFMHYVPMSLHEKVNYYWSEIDDLFREASYKGIKVNILVSVWNQTNLNWAQYWKSLDALQNIKVKFIRFPDSPFGEPAPFSRVTHSKYIVTDSQFYITTSNCAADYFYSTGGVGVVMNDNEAKRRIAKSMFLRDFESRYSASVNSLK